MPRRYLRPSQLPSKLQRSLGDMADLDLARATTRVEAEIASAIYDTDDDGMPTNPDVLKGIQNAIILQLLYWEETGDPSGALAAGGGGSIGPISLPSQGAGNTGGENKRSARESAEVFEHLRGIEGMVWKTSY